MVRGITIFTFGCRLEGPATGPELSFIGTAGGRALDRLHFRRASTQVRHAALQPLWTHFLLYIMHRVQGGGAPTSAVGIVAGLRFDRACLTVGRRRAGAGWVVSAGGYHSSLFST